MLALVSLAGLSGSLGYLLLFALVGAESTGVPVPGETALIAAGVLAHSGHLHIVPVILIAVAGVMVGDNLGYLIGRKGGRRLLEAPGPLAGHRRQVLERGEPFFAKHGPKAVFLGRWVAGLRIAAAWLAGINRMRWPVLLFWNALGAVAWSTSVGLLAYFPRPRCRAHAEGRRPRRRRGRRGHGHPLPRLAPTARWRATRAGALVSPARPAAVAARLAVTWLSLLAGGYVIGTIFADAGWGWDQHVVDALHGPASGGLDGPMRAITALGGPLVLDAVFAVYLAALLFTGRRREGVFLALASPGTVLLVQATKALVHRTRPIGTHLPPTYAMIGERR